MLTARTRLFHFVAIAAIISLGCYGCNKPAETPNSPGPSSGETGSSSGQGLTAEAAQELLPAAASMSIADFETLATAQTAPDWGSIKSQTLTLILLNMKMTKASADNQAVLEEFHWAEDFPHLSEIAEMIYKSKAKGYATFLQPNLITHCTCDSDGDTASGFVTFHAPDLYSGKVQFIARRNEGKWQIAEFLLPNYGIKTTLGTDNQWHQSGIDDPANRTDSTEAEKSESAPAAEAPAVGPPCPDHGGRQGTESN